MTTNHAPPVYRLVAFDQLAMVLRKPTAAPTLLPSEVIAAVLTSMQWKPNRFVSPDDLVIEHILSSLQQAGWKFEPL